MRGISGCYRMSPRFHNTNFHGNCINYYFLKKIEKKQGTILLEELVRGETISYIVYRFGSYLLSERTNDSSSFMASTVKLHNDCFKSYTADGRGRTELMLCILIVQYFNG